MEEKKPASVKTANNHKMALLRIMEYLMIYTDEEHPANSKDLKTYLEKWNISEERRTIYSDVAVLADFGIDIEKAQGGWYIASRTFELPELKLLVDCVQSAKFITDKKSNSLIKKIESITSRHQAKMLNRQVAISGRVKTMNESIYYNVDRLHEAINADRQITFYYFQWNVKKEQQLRHDGKLYKISPWGLMWDDENYYLVAYDSENDMIKHFRVDKMLKINITNDKRDGKECFKAFDMPKYTKSVFGMYGGKPERVKLTAKNEMAGVMIDRFGKDLNIIRDDKDHFRATVNVMVSPQFLAWIISLGDGVKITAPDNVVDMMKEEIKRLRKMYK